MIDSQGFRANIGIILTDGRRRVFWGRRIRQDAWQFPQGGIQRDEHFEQALYRELYEEVGLEDKDVKIIAQSKGWLRYRIPKRFIRQDSTPLCIGQKQRWFLLQLMSDDSNINLAATETPEFDDWQWVSYWYPLRHVIAFKREVYRRALCEFTGSVFHRNFEQPGLTPIFEGLEPHDP